MTSQTIKFNTIEDMLDVDLGKATQEQLIDMQGQLHSNVDSGTWVMSLKCVDLYEVIEGLLIQAADGKAMYELYREQLTCGVWDEEGSVL